MEFAWNTQKNKISDIKGLEKEQDRVGKISNPDIDLNKTYLNYDLVSNNLNLYQRIKKRIDEVKDISRIQKNSVVDYSNIITVSKEQSEIWGIDKTKEYFTSVYDYFCYEFGKENIISAKVHLDETAPHMHLHFVPVNVENGKLQARKVMTPQRINKIHTEAPKFLKERNFDIERGKGKTENSLPINQFKLDKLKDNINKLENTKSLLEIEIKTLEGFKMNPNDITLITPKKTLTGAIKGVKIEDIEKLKKIALKLNGYENKEKILNEEYKELLKEKEIYKNKLKNEFKNKLESLKQENIELKNKNNELEKLKKDYRDLNKSYFNLVQENSYNLDLILKLRKRIKGLIPKKINQYELNQMVKDHEEWINTNGLKGEQLDLEGKELNGLRLLNVDLEGANFKNTMIKDSSIFANLKNADFRGSKIESTEFLGSNLDNIKIDIENLRKIYRDLSLDKETHIEANATLKTNQNKSKNIEYELSL